MILPSKDVKNLTVDIPEELKGFINISANMEGVVPRLPQIKIIHRGQLYEMPDETKVGEFEGVILDQHPANAWWERDISESGGNSLPDCFSLDGITPEETSENLQSDKCATCKQNQFGSDKKTGKGKACKNMKRLHILMEGSLLPRRLTIPPTSIRSFESYMTNLVDRGLPYPCVSTYFSLKKKISESFEFAEVTFSVNEILSREDIIAVAGFIKQYKDSARIQEIRADEYETSDSFNAPPVEDDAPPIGDDDIPF